MMQRLAVLFAVVFGLFAVGARAQFGDDAPVPVAVSAVVRDGRLEVAFAIPPGQHITVQKDFDSISIEPKPVPGLEFGATVLPPVAEKDAEGEPVLRGTVTLSRTLKATAPVKAGTKLELTANWQVCLDSGTCFPPNSAVLNVELPELAAANAAVAPGTMPGESGRDAHAPVRNRAAHGLVYFLFLAFVGGLILNLMPCVLPVLSIKLLSLVKSADQSAEKIRNGALAYTAGVLLSFAALAAVMIVLKAGGSMAGWGFQLQNPAFVMVMLVIIWVFALSLFDLFMIRLPGMQTASSAASKQGLAGSFFSGVFAVLLGASCTAPVLGAALGFAVAQPAPVILLSFLLVGLGLAFPFLVAGFFPRATKFVPKPGAWMNTFREVMGFLLFGAAAWLLGVLYWQLDTKVLGVFWYLLVLSFACWLYGRFANLARPVRQQWFFTVLALAVAVGGWLWLVDLRPPPAGSAAAVTGVDKASGWEKFSPARVEELRKDGKPVFIDFGAAWCPNCEANENLVLYTDEIREAFRGRGVVPLRGDYTRSDPVIGEWLKRYRRAGVPLYLYYAPGAAEPVLLPELITKQMVLDLLKDKK